MAGPGGRARAAPSRARITYSGAEASNCAAAAAAADAADAVSQVVLSGAYGDDTKPKTNMRLRDF